MRSLGLTVASILAVVVVITCGSAGGLRLMACSFGGRLSALYRNGACSVRGSGDAGALTPWPFSLLVIRFFGDSGNLLAFFRRFGCDGFERDGLRVCVDDHCADWLG